MSGVFITFEGCEGCGKSTQMPLLANHLRGLGFDVITLREPGGVSAGDVGDRIRSVLLDPALGDMDPLAELLLYEAARAQLVSRHTRPALEAGAIVLCDRHADSSTAYQGYGREVIPLDTVVALNRIATGGLVPDLTFVLDVDVAEGLARATSGGADRIELEDLAFHERVRAGFLAIAAAEPERFVVIDAGPPAEVATRIREHVETLLRSRGMLG
jgi:dTMP kinase